MGSTRPGSPSPGRRREPSPRPTWPSAAPMRPRPRCGRRCRSRAPTSWSRRAPATRRCSSSMARRIGLVPYAWAQNTVTVATNAGVRAVLTTWEGAGHVPYADASHGDPRPDPQLPLLAHGSGQRREVSTRPSRAGLHGLIFAPPGADGQTAPPWRATGGQDRGGGVSRSEPSLRVASARRCTGVVASWSSRCSPSSSPCRGASRGAAEVRTPPATTRPRRHRARARPPPTSCRSALAWR